MILDSAETISRIAFIVRGGAPHVLLTAGSLALLLSSAAAADFSFTGVFHQDDERRDFVVTTSKATNLVVRTLSYGGGSNAARAVVPAGGFDPTVAVFDSAGLLIAVQRDDACPGASASFCWDARLNMAVPAGTYRVVLTQSDNTPQGPFSTDPFVYDGAGNFTSISGISLGTGFLDSSLSQRTGSFAIDISGVDSAQSGTTPGVNALVSAASGEAAKIAPNTILTFYQQGLGGGPLAASVGGLPATILFSNDSQMNFLVPSGVPVGSTVKVDISRGGTLLLSLPSLVQAASPALFTGNGIGNSQAAILNQDYSVNGPSIAAKPGDIVMVYGTGFGRALAPGADGLIVLASGVSATVGGIPAEVLFAGFLAGTTPGLQQINVKVPASSPVGAAVSIQLTTGGFSSQAGTTLAVAR